MRNRFEKELEMLNTSLIEMAVLVEQAIQNATRALVEQDVVEAKNVVEQDIEINEKEKEIERRCLKLLLQQQPVATDLRQISSALKIITDMERIGDQASDISEITIRLAGEQYLKELIHIPQMAEATIKMVKDCIDAFADRNLELAIEVIRYDDVVDGLFDSVKNDLIDIIRHDVKSGEQAIDLIMVAKYFERIGDHAVNIAGWVIFSITGEHKGKVIV